MTRLPETTADAVVSAVEACSLLTSQRTVQAVADFIDLPLAKAQAAVDLGCDLGLLRLAPGGLELASPIGRLLSTPILSQRAALMRISIESFAPFRTFRERLWANGGVASVAAQQTKALLALDPHREIVKETLVSLGTYSRSITAAGGGNFLVEFEYEEELRSQLSVAVASLSDADLRVRDWVSEELRSYADEKAVLDPLAEAYLKATQGDARGTILSAGNAVESFLDQLAVDMSLVVAKAFGIGAKINVFDTSGKLPKKVIAISRYLSNVRNGADHGIDSDVQAAWSIRSGTGQDYLRVTISFMETCLAVYQGKPPTL